MELSSAAQLALELMNQFGLSDWRFKFDNAKRRFGVCSRVKHTISLSKHLVLKNDKAVVEDTVRHEIAHALCSVPQKKGSKYDFHGAEWKAMCAITGAKPKTYFDKDVNRVEKNWYAVCAGCGFKYTRYRRSRLSLFCGVKSCIAQYGLLQPIQKLVWQHKDAKDKYPSEVLAIANLKGVKL